VPWAQWPPPEGPLTGALQLISSKQGKKLAAQQNKLDAINFEELAEVFASFDLDPCISAIRSEPDPLIRDRKLAYIIGRGKRRAILLVSPEEFPDVASNERARTDLMRRHLGDDLGSVIPEYFATGYLRSQSYSLSPLLPTISADRFLGRFQVFQIRKSLFEWIQNINSRCNVVSDSVETEFIRPLEYLSRFDDPVIQQAIPAECGRAAPRCTMIFGEEISCDPDRPDIHLPLSIGAGLESMGFLSLIYYVRQCRSGCLVQN
jgi:hypothetical protein